MLRKRFVFTLIYENGQFNQSRNFRLQKVGDINWLERNYKFKNIALSLDELVVLNASRSKDDLDRFSIILERLVGDVFIPIAAGGGIKCAKDARLLFNSGADKLVLNSLLYTSPHIAREIIAQYGSQSVIASIDYKSHKGVQTVFISNGTQEVDMELAEYIEYVEGLGVGEIYLNSMDNDGTGFGYDFDTIDKVSVNMNVPLIIAGGAGNEEHLVKGLKRERVDAVATANLFNFVGDGLSNAREKTIAENLNIADWNR